jgi:hypothetical protein
MGNPHAAKLDLIEPEVDPKTATVRFRGTLANPMALTVMPSLATSSARTRVSPSSPCLLAT